MPRVIIGGKLVFLGYIEPSAHYLIQEILQLIGQTFTWDEGSDTLVIEPQTDSVNLEPQKAEPAPVVMATTAATPELAPLPTIVMPKPAETTPAPPPPPPTYGIAKPQTNLSQLLSGLIDGSVMPALASSVIGRPISIGYGQSAMNVLAGGAPTPATLRIGPGNDQRSTPERYHLPVGPGGVAERLVAEARARVPAPVEPEEPLEFDDPLDAMMDEDDQRPIRADSDAEARQRRNRADGRPPRRPGQGSTGGHHRQSR